jgi:solute carrier family 25, member 34/35
VQLPSYNFTKRSLVKHAGFDEKSPLTFLASSSVSGACVVRSTGLHTQSFAKGLDLACRDAASRYCKPKAYLLCPHPLSANPQALTRVYNQPTTVGVDGKVRGALYKNPIDCLWKTFKAEGVRGWYKGEDTLPHIIDHSSLLL